MKRKNILLLWLDGLRADRIGCYGYRKPTTPTLDKLAENGAVFLNNYSVSNCSLPAYFSIFTGLYPCVHKASSTSGYYDGQYPFLTDLLRDAGYYTFGISNNVAGFSPEWGFIRGYDRFYRVGKVQNWFKQSKQAQRGFNKSAMRRRLIRGASALSPRFSDWSRARYSDHYYGDHDMGGAKAVAVFDQALNTIVGEGKAPFFGFLNIPDTHHPYIPPHFVRKEFGSPRLTPTLALLNHFPMEFEKRGLTLSAKEFDDLGSFYDATVKYVDLLVERVLRKLKDSHLAEDTVLVIFGDHGGNLFEKRGYLGSASYTYEAEIRVPLMIINADGLIGRHTQLTSLIDLFPTLLSIAGAEFSFDRKYQGKNLLHDRQGHDAVLIDYPKWPNWILKNDPELPGHFFVKYDFTNRTLVRNDGWKLIWRSDGAHELFQLRSDPREDRNLFDEKRGFAFELIKQLVAMYSDLIGDVGRRLEIYDWHAVGSDMELLPPLDVVNRNFDWKSVVHVENPDRNSILSLLREAAR